MMTSTFSWTRALGFGLLGGMVGAGLHYGLALWAGWLMTWTSLAIGIGSGLGVRWGSGAQDMREALAAGLSGVVWVLVGESFVVAMDYYTFGVLQFGLSLVCAGVGGVFVAQGVNPLDLMTSMATGDTFSVGSPRDREGLRGTVECPQCGSMQTEAAEPDFVSDKLRSMHCNACGHQWPIA
ncbi:MAG: hypothetical protein AAFS10_09300 [Myxococcota bacterium]